MKKNILLTIFLATLAASHAFTQEALPAKTVSIALEGSIAPSWHKKKSVTLAPGQELIVNVDNSNNEYHNSTMKFGNSPLKDRDSNAVFYEIDTPWSSIVQKSPLEGETELNTTGEVMTYHFKASDSKCKNATIYFYSPESSDAALHIDSCYFSPGIDVAISAD